MLNRNNRPEGLVIKTFAREDDAERAVRTLIDAGFTQEQISIVAKERERAQQVAEDTGTEVGKGAGIGAATGGILGGLAGLLVGAASLAIPGIGVVVAGPLAVALSGAAAGGLTGGLAGALAGWGVAEDEAEQYQRRLEAGDILVVVAAGDREPEARRILYG